MNQQLNSATLMPRPVGLGWSLFWLTAGVVVAFPLYASFGFYRFGMTGVVATAVAGFVCWIGAALALWCAAALQSHSPIGGLLAGMFFRMGLPLVVGGLLHFNIPELARVGIFAFVLAYYFLTLILETFLAIRMIPHDRRVAKSS